MGRKSCTSLLIWELPAEDSCESGNGCLVFLIKGILITPWKLVANTSSEMLRQGDVNAWPCDSTASVSFSFVERKTIRCPTI